MVCCSSDNSDTVEPVSKPYNYVVYASGSGIVEGEFDASESTGAQQLSRSISEGSNLNFNVRFTYGDTIGIFAQGGSQIPFIVPITNVTDRLQRVTLTAQGFSTFEGTKYVPYLPYNFYNRNGSRIPWDLRTIQRQRGVTSQDSVSNYWLLADTTLEATLQDGVYTFNTTMNPYNTFIVSVAVAPETANYIRMMLVAPDKYFGVYGYFDMFDTSAKKVDDAASRPIPYLYQPYTALESSDHIILDLEDCNVSKGTQIWGYMVSPEVDLGGQTLKLYLWDDQDNLYVTSTTLRSSGGKARRGRMMGLMFSGTYTKVANYDVTLNDWEKAELCPTCTPVAW